MSDDESYHLEINPLRSQGAYAMNPPLSGYKQRALLCGEDAVYFDVGNNQHVCELHGSERSRHDLTHLPPDLPAVRCQHVVGARMHRIPTSDQRLAGEVSGAALVTFSAHSVAQLHGYGEWSNAVWLQRPKGDVLSLSGADTIVVRITHPGLLPVEEGVALPTIKPIWERTATAPPTLLDWGYQHVYILYREPHGTRRVMLCSTEERAQRIVNVILDELNWVARIYGACGGSPDFQEVCSDEAESEQIRRLRGLAAEQKRSAPLSAPRPWLNQDEAGMAWVGREPPVEPVDGTVWIDRTGAESCYDAKRHAWTFRRRVYRSDLPL